MTVSRAVTLVISEAVFRIIERKNQILTACCTNKLMACD